MTTEYWNKKHINHYSKTSWARKPSIFAVQAIEFFPKSGKVLEIGTGQGGDADFFQSRGYEVIATDYADEALKIAKENVKNVSFVNIDTTQGLPFEDESFDVVYSHMALHYFDDQKTEQVFSDIHRILKAGGIFATITNTMDDSEKEGVGYVELHPGYYKDPDGIQKRYFSVDSIQTFTKGLFEPMLIDNHGETYKDDIFTLIRFIGKKI